MSEQSSKVHSDGRANGSNPAGTSRLDPNRLEQVLNDGINALPSGFALFDADERAVLTNRVFREMLPEGAEVLDSGASFPEMARQNAITQFGLEGEELEDWMIQRLAYRDTPKDYFDQRLKDGRWFRIQESRTSDGGTVTNWTDITDLKLQEKAAQESSDALKATNQQLDEFARAASHDLQEPLRKIEVFGSRLSEKCGDQLDEKGMRYLDRMLDSTVRMKHLITALLDFSRSTDQRPSFGPVNLNSVINDALQNLDLQVQSRDATITIGALPEVQANSDQLSRLFQNLLSNALKYVMPGTPPKISVDLVAEDSETVQISILDNGIGFEQEYAEKIFEPFQRLHGRNAGYDGTGIGLASCRRIVQQHNGSIHAKSVPDEGSTFFVTLPLKASRPAA